jgi:hypothetical protein
MILLDVDGVLNPTMVGGEVAISRERADLVLKLVRAGELVWVTSWTADVTFQLDREIGLEGQMRRVPLAGTSDGASTPKLRSIARWVERSTLSMTPIVWIDDWLRSDARAWAARQERSWLLVQPEPAVGLTSDHVQAVIEFLTVCASGADAYRRIQGSHESTSLTVASAKDLTFASISESKNSRMAARWPSTDLHNCASACSPKVSCLSAYRVADSAR